MGRYASVIIDIALEKLDRPFTYKIPAELEDKLEEGMEVCIPFGKGNTLRKGYVVATGDRADLPDDMLKYIDHIAEKSVNMEGRTLALAAWMKKNYGGTLITAMRTVLPVKKKMKELNYGMIHALVDEERLKNEINALNPIRFAARIKLYKALLSAQELPEDMVKDKLNISAAVLKTAEKDGIIKIEKLRRYRAPVAANSRYSAKTELNDEQRAVVDEILRAREKGDLRPALLHGVTGSGKTEVYLELIEKIVAEGRQAIVLIPEISLTFQTLMRFYARFGERVSVMHSKLSDGERYDQYERARKGELDIIIGPRSALFVPFERTGIIIIDEEHEGSYKSEKMPKYHAREVAAYLAERENALLVMGSATPSLESYYRTQKDEYRLFSLRSRFGNAVLPKVYIEDMRAELKSGNKGFLSRRLSELLTERMLKGEQSMLFINRRGIAGFVSCRSCGYVVNCPHCSVSLTEHKDGFLHCHYCGHKEEKPGICPKCASKYIAGFKAGTERMEEELKKLYPSAGILRMDADTTKNKADYDRILSSFANGEADILLGTQMIVKGHDFPNVTLVGALAADMSLNLSDYHSAERTFQLLAQAAGRAGRAERKGEVVIQTYQPEHYAIQLAAAHDYEDFYEQEMSYRELADFPPVCHMLTMQFFSSDVGAGMERAVRIADAIRAMGGEIPEIIGPAEALIGKLKDSYRTGLYIRHKDMKLLNRAKDAAEEAEAELATAPGAADVMLQFDFDPVNSF
ncbi:MAG: primosomal protein N' [Lachnospiraceae bacterium]|nr:primosomal protein N' [Lachnospiraceae bacterium]